MKKVVIGVDVGGTNVKLGLVSATGRVLARTHFSTKNFTHSKTTLINAIIDNINELTKEYGLKKKNISGIGFGLPGLIDPKKGVVKVLPNVPGWHNVALKKIVQQKTKLPVVIDNDVNLITLAEWKYGAGRGYKNLVCITLGTGVGGGLVFDNHFYRGPGYVAGEIGHFPYQDKTFERYVGNKTLTQLASKRLRRKITEVSEVHLMAKKGHKGALKFWKSVAEHLAPTLIGTINLLNPPLVIIGGGVSNNFPFFAPKLKSLIKQKAMPVQGRMVKIVRAKLGNDAGLIGAQILLKGKYNALSQ